MSREDDPGWKYLRLTLDEMLAAQQKPYDSKVDVWIPDAVEGYLHAQIKSDKGDSVVCTPAKGGTELTVKKDLLMEMNPPKFTKTEDMSNLSFLNDASVLWNLRDRYQAMLIYTYSGLFCVVINPYKRLPIYTDSVSRIYMGKRKNEVPPHLWSVSDEALRNMLQDRECQSMLITGESGAGKTENTKKVIAYFACVGQAQQEAADGGKKQDMTGKVSLEDKIVQTNPVLEAFGNAKTVRNNNSSRFGKFIRIHFSKDGRVAGCDIEHYLLEKSRVIRQAPGERCYHIFYQIMSGHDKELCAKLELTQPKDYWYVNQAEVTIKGVNDKEEFALTDEAFDVLNFNKEEKFDCYRLCSALCHMGEMKFKEKKEQAEPDGTEEAKKAASMYGVDWEPFLKAFCKPRVKVGNEWVNKGQNAEQVNWGKGAMTKGIYNRIFDWLVIKCNLTLDAREIPRSYFIGVLDIAGFEIFDFNSFEQLWINFVNEKLQQFFNHHMFVLEQEEYQREGINWVFIDFGLDLAACIELIEKPGGIISMLDEECIVPKGTDTTLAAKLTETHLGKHPSFDKPKPPKGKQAEAHFAMKHYAGLVRYNVSAWLEKNKDPLNDTVVSVMKNGKGNALLSFLWTSYETQEEAALAAKSGDGGGGRKKGKSAGMMTVSMKYRESLNALMTMLGKTHPHFIRCLIPNEQKKSGMLEAELVLNQLSCNGVLEGIRICRKGFPNRMQHADFVFRYKILASDEAKKGNDKPVSEAMMKKVVSTGRLTEEDFRVGLTKVFFKAGMLARMEDIRDETLSTILKGMQAYIRWGNQQKEYKKRAQKIAALKVLQNNIRAWAVLRTWEWFIILGKAKVLAESAKDNERLQELMDKASELEGAFLAEEAKRTALKEDTERLNQVKAELIATMEKSMGGYAEMQAKTEQLEESRVQLKKDVEAAMERATQAEDMSGDVVKEKKKAEQDLNDMRKKVQDVEMSLRKVESEKASKEHAIRALQEEMSAQEGTMTKGQAAHKLQEEQARKLTEDLHAEEDKVNHLTKMKQKLEQSLGDMDGSLASEKSSKQDLERNKRKLEGENRVAAETIDELQRQKNDVDNQIRRKEQELHSVTGRLEDEQSSVIRLQRTIKECQSRISEQEEELESERQARSKADRSKGDLQDELADLSSKLEEAGGSTQMQMEMNKKREAELAKLRRDLEESNMQHENQLGVLRKKHADAVAEMTDQLDQLQKQKSKTDKEMHEQVRRMDELNSTLDLESKGKSNNDKLAKALEMQVQEAEAKLLDTERALMDMQSMRNRLANENADCTRQSDDCKQQLDGLQRMKSAMAAQLEETRRHAEEEARERQSLSAQSKNLQHEVDTMRDQVEEESQGRQEVQRQVTKAQAEIQTWRSKFESEGLTSAEEMEEAKRKIAAKIKDLQEVLATSNTKIATAEKTRARMMGELDDAQVEVERSYALAMNLEKKQQGFEKQVDEWRRKHDDLNAELDASQRETRMLGSELIKLKGANDETVDLLDSLRRENKNLAHEIKDLADQLSEGGRSAHDMHKMVRRLEIEKEELQMGLDEAENALQSEESKVQSAQTEVAQIRQDIEKRIHEKEEEFENTRKMHGKAIESMQASLETETRGRGELVRAKKKLESDINELEIALDHANKANSDAQKNLRRYQEQITELQMQIDDEQRQKDELKEQFATSERRLASLQTEKSEVQHVLEGTDRARRQAEQDAQEARDTANELQQLNAGLLANKRKAEGEMHALHADLEGCMVELRGSEEAAKKAMSDAARLAEELRQEQEHSMHVERMRKGLENSAKEMQVRLDDAEQNALKSGKKTIQKLESRCRELEAELDGEQRRHSDGNKATSHAERRNRELQFHVDENKKTTTRLTDLIDKLQQKLKMAKRQVEEAETLATSNLQKYRQLQGAYDAAEERADQAEQNLTKLRTKSRSAMSVGPSSGLATSRSMARSSSRAHISDY